MSLKWYYAKDNTPVGPFSLEKMKELYLDQTISDTTFVWKEGTPDWKYYKDTELAVELPPELVIEEQTVVLHPSEQSLDNLSNHEQKAEWYFLKGVTLQGPFSKDAMKTFYEKEEIDKDTLVLLQGEENWQTYRSSTLYTPAAKVELMPDKSDIGYTDTDRDDGATEVYQDDMTSTEPYEYNAFDDFDQDMDTVEEWYIDNDGPYTLRAIRALYRRGNIPLDACIAKTDGTVLSHSMLKEDESPAEDKWFIAKNGKPDGPYSAKDIRSQVESEMLDIDTLIWKEGLKDWIKIRESSLGLESQIHTGSSTVKTKDQKQSRLSLIAGILTGIAVLGGIGLFFFGKEKAEPLVPSSITGNWKLSQYAPADGDFWDLSFSEVQKLTMSVDVDGDLTIRTQGRDIYIGTWTIDGSSADVEGELNDQAASLDLTVNEKGEVVLKENSDVTLIFVEDADAFLTTQNEPEEKEEPVKEEPVVTMQDTYILNYDMNLRSEPNRTSSDVGDMKAGASVTIVEINDNSDGKWGKTSDGRWICISDANYTYLTKQ